MERRIKGSILVDFVKTIKADKTGAYERYLTAQDKNIINQRILPSAWYPYETFRNCFNAVFEVLAKKNLDMVRQWGRFYGEQIIESLYKGLLKQGHPLDYIRKYEVYIKNFFDFGKIEVIEEAQNQVLIKMSEFDPEFPPLYSIMLGWLERTLELCGAKNIKMEVVSKSWEGAKETAVRFKWTL
jgi:hypothetical protein